MKTINTNEKVWGGTGAGLNKVVHLKWSKVGNSKYTYMLVCVFQPSAVRIIFFFFFFKCHIHLHCLILSWLPHKHQQNFATTNTAGMGTIMLPTTNVHKQKDIYIVLWLNEND